MTKRITRPMQRQSFRAMPPAPIVHLRVCRKGYMYAGPVKIGQYIPSRRTVRVLDRCKARGERRGSRFVEVPAEEFGTLGTLCCEVEEEHGR